MNTRFLVHTILAAASLASFSAAAADLKDVYERALTNDPVIREAEALRLAARESRPQAIGGLLPQINGNARHNETESSSSGIDVDPPDADVVDQDRDGDSDNWNVELRQSVFSWQNWATLRRASAETAQAEADYDAAQQDLILRTSEAYFNV